MTAPVPHGYPDWGRYAAQADVELIGTSALNQAVAVTFGRFFVGGVRHCAYIFTVATNHATVTLETYTAETGGTLLSQQTIECRAGGGFDVSIPVQGPWLAITVTPVGGAIDFDLNVWTTAGNLASVTGPMAPRYALSQINIAVAAGATVTTNIPYTYPGLGHWVVFHTAATFNHTLRTIDSAGAVKIIDQITQTTPPGARLIHIPPIPMQLAIQNTSGAAAAYNASIIVGGIITAT